MIKVDKDTVKFDGKRPIIEVEISMIAHASKDLFGEERVRCLFEIGLKTEEELEREIKKIRENLDTDLDELLNELPGGLKDE